VDDRLFRSTADRALAGVCGGLAAWLGLDPSLVRVAWVLLSLASGGVFVLIYVVMAVVVPDAPPGWSPRGRAAQPGPPPGAWAGPPPTPWGARSPGSGGSGGRIDADRAAVVAGGALVALGAWFLVRVYVPINWDLLWPLAVIGLGALLIAGALGRSR